MCSKRTSPVVRNTFCSKRTHTLLYTNIAERPERERTFPLHSSNSLLSPHRRLATYTTERQTDRQTDKERERARAREREREKKARESKQASKREREREERDRP